MTRPSKIVGIGLSMVALIFIFQNCTNKENVNLENAIKYAQERSSTSTVSDPKVPILLTFSNTLNGNPVDTFSSGETVYARILNAGSNAMICLEKDAQVGCLDLSNFPSTWSDMYGSGWTENKNLNTWTKQFNVGADLTAGTYRFYFARPKIDDPTKVNNFGSVTIKIQ